MGVKRQSRCSNNHVRTDDDGEKSELGRVWINRDDENLRTVVGFYSFFIDQTFTKASSQNTFRPQPPQNY